MAKRQLLPVPIPCPHPAWPVLRVVGMQDQSAPCVPYLDRRAAGVDNPSAGACIELLAADDAIGEVVYVAKGQAPQRIRDRHRVAPYVVRHGRGVPLDRRILTVALGPLDDTAE